MRAERAVTSLFQRNALAIAVASCFAGYAYANPTNPTVISGAAIFAASGKTLNVTNTPGAIINWQGFSVKADELTRFIQQNAQSAVLNRVTSQEQSAILGQLLSNGRVYLINPNGITVGAGARIDTAGFVASSLSLSDKDALAGKFKLQDTGSSGKVVNNGTITTATGGFVYLVAPNVENNGVITSPKGEIILAAGKSVELVDSQKPELRVLLTAPENTAVNVGKMIAEAGSIGIFAGAIRQSGLISANSAVVGENGKIVLRAKKDITLAAGSKTEASGSQGGSITIQSESGTTLVAGTVEAKATSTPTVYQLRDPAPSTVVTDLPQNPDVVQVKVDLKLSNAITTAGKGGSVSILGDLVGLIDHAVVDASGEAGGGQILVGGDYQGKNPEVQNAQRTYVGKDVQLIADAVLRGDGGKVIVWADNDTNFVGSIWTRGGKEGGNGGLVETSGKNVLYFRGRVDVGAPLGRPGSLLLDPDSITIAGGTGGADDAQVTPNPNASVTYDQSSGTSYTISEAALESQTAGTVTLQARNSISTSGVFNNASGNLGDGTGILALKSGVSVVLQTRNNLTTNGDVSGSINLSAVHLKTDAGSITISAGTSAVGAKGDVVVSALTTQNSGNVALSAGGTGATVTLGGAMTTASGTVTISSAAALTADVTINTASGGGGGITFTSTINGGQGLTLNAGAGGDITLSGVLGNTARLGAILINSANNVTTNGVRAASFVQSAGLGTTTLNAGTFTGPITEALNTNTGTGVSLTGAAQTANGAINTSSGGAVTFANAGLLTVNADITSDGAVAQTGTGAVKINTDRTITTTADAVSFAADVTLAKTGGTGLLTINTTSGSAVGNNITFSGKLDGTTAGAEPVTLNAGTGGNVLFSGAVGSGTRLGAIKITNAKEVTESAGVTAASLVQSAGTGTTTLTGPVNADTVTGVQITTNNILMGGAGTITTTVGSFGVVTLTNSGALTIGAAINADGDVTVNGSGGPTLLNSDIVTTKDLVQFYQPVILTGNRRIETTAAPAIGAGGAISFLNTVDGAGNSLTLAAPATGDITFNQAASNMSALTVTSGRNFSTAATAPISVGSGGISVTVGGTVTTNSTITTSSSGSVTIASGGVLTLNGNISAGGSGNVALKTTGANDVNLNAVTVSSTSGNLQVISGRHILTNTPTGTTTEFSTTGSLLLDAQDSIGTVANRIDTTVGTVAATSAGVSTAGDIFINQTAGALTIGTATGLDGRADLSGITTGANNNDITVVSRTGSISVTGPISANGDALLQALGAGSDIAILNNFTGTSAATGKTLTLQADRNIVFNSGAHISTTNALNVLLNSDYSDGNSAGAIQLNSGTVINSNGGSITLGGGSSPLAMAAIGTGALADGVKLDNAQLISGTGTISIRGTGAGGIGVNVSNSSSVTSSGAAVVQITGTGTAGSSDIKVASGTNSIGGASAAGDILLNGTTSGGSVLGAGGDSTTLQTTGNITLNQTGGGVSQGGGSLLANGLRLIGSGAYSLNQASNNINVLVADLTGAATTLSYRDANGFSIGTGTGGLSTVKTAGGVADTSKGITVGTAATAANTLTLNAYGAVTQATSADNATAGGLQLLGNGPFTLSNAGNDVTTFAANVAGNISYRDTNAFTVGIVTDAPSAVSTAGITTISGGTLTLDNGGVMSIAQNISTDGAFAQISSAGSGSVSIASPRSISTTGDAVSFTSAVALNGAGTTTINTDAGASTTGANVSFSSTLTGTTASAENLVIAAGSGGGVTFTGAVGATLLGDVTISQARDVTVQSSFNAKTLTQSQGATGAPSTTPSAGTTTINAAVNTTGNTSLTTSGALNVTSAGSIATGAGSSVTLTSGNDMTLSGNVTAPAGATLNVKGTDRILTQNGGTISTTDSAVALIADEMMLTAAINSVSGAVTLKPNNTADAIQLGVAAAATNNAAATLELAISELNTITTTGGLTIGASNNTGAITIAGALTPTTAQNGFTLLNNTGGIAINAPVTYAAGNGNLTLSANGGGAAAGAITTNGAALDVSGTLAMNAATGVGTLAAPMVLSHAGGTTLTVTNTRSGGVFERADVGDLNVSSINNSAAASGGINLNVGTNLNINGTVQNTIGDIQLVAGNDTAYTGTGGFGLSPASVPAGTLGGVNFNGQVIARNAGAISIFSTGAVKQSTTVAAGLQSIAAAGTVAQGPLKVRTFNNGSQVGVIDLRNNLAGSGNSVGPITLEARLAGSVSPPPYAQSNLDYKSISGTNISGIGTAADFSLVAPSQTIDLAAGASLSGTNVTLIASAGDVTLRSAITNAQINGGQPGGSLNLYATGNIILNNPGGSSSGVVIGKDLGTLDPLGNRQFEKFDHTLKLVATGDVRIFGTVQVTGDLALRANASASEATGSGGVAGFGAGLGSVIIAGSAGNPVEVRAMNIFVGVEDASDNPLPVQNLIIDNSANTADTGKFFDTVLRANEKLDIYLNGDQGGAGTSGNIIITGGTAWATSAKDVAKSSALAAVRGDVVTIIGIRGGVQVTQDPDRQTVNPLAPYASNSSNITVQGGTATSNTKAGGGALAAADALILGTSSKFIDIGGNLLLTGGTADSKDGGQVSASAAIDPVNLVVNTGGYIKLIGGTGPGAPAALLSVGDIQINVGGKFDYTYKDSAGNEHTVPNVGLLLAGGIGSGIFDRNNQPITLISDVSSQVLILFPAINGGAGGGSYYLNTDTSKATAFVQSLSARGFDDSLLAYILFAANVETRTGRIRTGVVNADDMSKPSCN